MTKYIFITGGVVSGLGKGICAASLGRLLKQRGLKVVLQKFDPYLNVDPGTMSPYQHGEVFVTDDGAETDLDLGHYERFVDENLTGNCSVSSGKVYWSALSRERRGDYLGATVQIIPHITDEIKSRIYALAEEKTAAGEAAPDVVISEIGGTVGDIESQAFLESIRQVAGEKGRENVLFIHVALIVKIPGDGELKSKPVQHSVKELLSIGIQPDILVCRSDDPITDEIRRKISLFCNVEPECVIQNLTAPSLYQVPLYLEKEGLDRIVCRKLGLETPPADLIEWRQLAKREAEASGCVKIALVGKYVALHDAYLSVVEALNHAGTENGVKVKIKWVNSELLTDDNTSQYLSDCQGIIVPGGFGDRGIEGMISAARYARENNVPYFGICLGMQMAVIEFARHAVGMEGAHSTEFNEETPYPVIALMESQKSVTSKGGTMRLGKYPCVLAEGSLSRKLYGSDRIDERHRHRFEMNTLFRAQLEEKGMVVTGLSPDGLLPEIVEVKDHPWFVGVQFHPEFKSRPNRPHPMFVGFIAASKNNSDDSCSITGQDKVHEECGVFGVYSPEPTDVASLAYYGLYALQHRGQESCGIIVNDDGLFSSHKDLGLVSEAFTKDVMAHYPQGCIAVGHVRYGTTGGNSRRNCQPIEVNHSKGKMALAHNGNLSNAYDLRIQLEMSGAIFHTTSDTETIAYIITGERLTASSIEEAVSRAMDKLEGAYSLVLMSSTKLIAVRDPKGFRPLCFGQRADGTYVVASESCALQAVGADFIRDVMPGEIIVFNKDGMKSITEHCGKSGSAKCIFEYIYFARPDSVIDGFSVHASRLAAGRILARTHPVDADVVIGVPDSGLDAALGFSQESGIPYGIGFIKNKYIGRTFISPGQSQRADQVKIKLNAIKETVCGKRVVMIDDSIVRGNTSGRIVKLLREAGASEVHMRVSSPPFLNPCYYGTDIDSRENLIACSHTTEEIAQIIGADSLGYLPMEALSELAMKTGYCSACFSGNYPTSVPEHTAKDRFEQKLSGKSRK